MVWDNSMQRNITKQQFKSYSAYMLFYERVQPVSTQNVKLLPKQESGMIQSSIFSSIWEENMKFLRDKNIFDSQYFSFIWRVITMHPNAIANANAQGFDALFISIKLATRFILATLSHAKDKPHLKDNINELKLLYNKHPLVGANKHYFSFFLSKKSLNFFFFFFFFFCQLTGL